MAEPISFPGANFTFMGDGEVVVDLHVFRQPRGPANVSCWRLSPEELEEINRTGCIFQTVMSGSILYPCFVGSESATRALVVDTGPVWIREGSDNA
ncbi:MULTISPECIES: hypothetical protein [Alphaproteobacteria]|uniref:hypothetical protein n=1 Tax=Alphaproteobacteria TaxID=28211 RepID=UPI00086A9C43|nr:MULTISPECIES: hypothetical protein [Alphaproteobacteria]MBN9143714.1 hypothetical protein [Novosphingobium sp.]MBN9333802.1 hypothetical protein [Devosia sp.]ODU84328.1 MAG: hypothetical protein ABT10_02795 [Novosphingobium sp. SCN 63-17]OJX92868.1 MAG: hypothetical protein BGP00_23395 [Novosphingobium sp. 63-713]